MVGQQDIPGHPIYLWTKNVTCHISKQRMLRPSSHQPLQPQLRNLRGFRMEKNRILALDNQGANQRNDFIEPRFLHLPIHRKALNSLTWDVWFSLINSNLLMFWLLVFVAKHPISWLLPYLFGTVPQSYLRGWLPGLSPQYVHWITHNSQLRLCIFFSRHTSCHSPGISHFFKEVPSGESQCGPQGNSWLLEGWSLFSGILKDTFKK